MEEDNGGEEEEEEEDSHRVQYSCGQRERAERPLWYCEAATAVALGRG